MLLLSREIPVHAVSKHVRLIYLSCFGKYSVTNGCYKVLIKYVLERFWLFSHIFQMTGHCKHPSFVSPIRKGNCLPHPSQKALGSSQGPTDIVVKPSMENMGTVVHPALPVQLSQLIRSYTNVFKNFTWPLSASIVCGLLCYADNFPYN